MSAASDTINIANDVVGDTDGGEHILKLREECYQHQISRQMPKPRLVDERYELLIHDRRSPMAKLDPRGTLS